MGDGLDPLELPDFLDRRKHPRDTDEDFNKARKRHAEIKPAISASDDEFTWRPTDDNRNT